MRDSENYHELSIKRQMTPVKALRLILEGKAQKLFLQKSEPKLMTDFQSVLADLDSCTTIEELQIIARANGIEITQEELNFAIDQSKK